MKRFLVILSVFLCGGCAGRAGLVNVENASGPKVFLDIRYATENNFTGKKVYPAAKCYLARPAAKGLEKAARAAASSGLSLCALDCYRPLSVQKKFWEILPDPRYVADPKTGSKHNRGYAVDVTLCRPDGSQLEMPTAYDDFTEKAWRSYVPPSAAAAENRAKLEKLMSDAGFVPLPTEWWHFDYPGWEKAPVLDISFEELAQPDR